MQLLLQSAWRAVDLYSRCSGLLASWSSVLLSVSLSAELLFGQEEPSHVTGLKIIKKGETLKASAGEVFSWLDMFWVE